MSIVNPSQYDCDNMEQGDMIVVKYRNPIYKWYRDKFQTDKIKIHVRVNWDTDEKVERYQEDCTLLFSWEILGKCDMKDTVPYFTGYNNKLIKIPKKLQNLQFGTENTQLTLKSGINILLPTQYIREGITKLDSITSAVDEQRQIKQALKFARYNGEFFKKKVQELDIKIWDISYCNVCGKSISIDFSNEEPHIYNRCECGNTKLQEEDINYDMVAYWYNRQVVDVIRNRYKEFWKI